MKAVGLTNNITLRRALDFGAVPGQSASSDSLCSAFMPGNKFRMFFIWPRKANLRKASPRHQDTGRAVL